MFNLNEFLKDLVVEQNDEELIRASDVVEANLIMAGNDKYLARQLFFGVSGAMERQLEYVGGTLLPMQENKLQRMNSQGVMGESYVMDSWFGESNNDDPHTNDEIPYDQVIDNQRTFIDEIKQRMRTAAIIFVTNVRAHDDLSKAIVPQQLSYGAIKAKAASNRQARQASTG